jgi:peptide-methionine (S)-S-oxide reductase
LLKVFWKTHDPTTLNQQGADRGTQYRSAIFYHDDEQKEIAESMKAEIDSAKVFNKPIVTEITKFDKFFEAEAYHNNYYDNNPAQPYCSFVITPKVRKLETYFADKLK